LKDESRDESKTIRSPTRLFSKTTPLFFETSARRIDESSKKGKTDAFGARSPQDSKKEDTGIDCLIALKPSEGREEAGEVIKQSNA